MIDLHQRGQLSRHGKPAALEFLEREDAAAAANSASGNAGAASGGGGGGTWAGWTRRLTAADWTGGVRCRDLTYSYK